jgi:hypothetical protein
MRESAGKVRNSLETSISRLVKLFPPIFTRFGAIPPQNRLQDAETRLERRLGRRKRSFST